MLSKYKCKFVFVMTLPICPLDGKLEWYSLIKSKVNEEISKLASKKIIIIDVAKEIPFFDMTDEEKQSLWCDELHFIEIGYNMLADIFATISKLLVK
jgi:hypothetical protein